VDLISLSVEVRAIRLPVIISAPPSFTEGAVVDLVEAVSVDAHPASATPAEMMKANESLFMVVSSK
jgi:hypothetical protein